MMTDTLSNLIRNCQYVFYRINVRSYCTAGSNVALSSSPRPWMDVFALPEKSNMAGTESDPDPKVRNMSITF